MEATNRIQIRERHRDAVTITLAGALPQTDSQWHRLYRLLGCLEDALHFRREDGRVRFVRQTVADVPWHNALGGLIARAFQAQLLAVLPDGDWYLGLADIDPPDPARGP